MIQERNLDTLNIVKAKESNELSFPILNSNSITDGLQKESFLFLYRREHTAFILPDTDMPPSAFIWQQSMPSVRITMKKIAGTSTTASSFNTNLDESAGWEWLKENVNKESVKPYCPQSETDDSLKRNGDTNVMILEDIGSNTSSDKKALTKKEFRELVFDMAQQGYTSRAIAEKLNVSLFKVNYGLKVQKKLRKARLPQGLEKFKIPDFKTLLSRDAVAELSMKLHEQGGYKLKDLAAKFNIRAMTLQRIVATYKRFGTTEPPAPSPQKKVHQKHKEFLIRLLENKEKPMSSIPEIRRHFEAEFNLKVSDTTIWTAIKSLGYTRKKARLLPGDRNGKRMIELRKQIVMQMISKWNAKKIPIFLDETGFQNSMFSGYFYSKKGEWVYRKSRVVNTTMIRVILAITPDAFLGYQCFNGGITSSDFYAFLCELLKHNREIYDHLDDYVFVLDNSGPHRHADYSQFREFLQMVYLPPYSPFLNPIEQVFGEWKRSFRGKPFRGLSDVMNSVHETFKRLDRSLLPKVYAHSLSFYPKCLKGLPID